MTEEYRIIEEEHEHETLMAEALKVGENITALASCSGLKWGITMEELLEAVPHMHLLEYSLTVMEGMGLIAHTDLDNPIWDEYECGFDDDQERFRAANHMDPIMEGPERRVHFRTSRRMSIRKGLLSCARALLGYAPCAYRPVGAFSS